MSEKSKINKWRLFEKIGYEPHARQREYHESTARFRLASCGRRFGKTTMVARDLEPDLLIPNTVNWIVGPSYSLGEKEFRVIWDDLMVKLGMLNLKGIQKSYNVQQGKMFIKFPWNTVLEVKSANKAESLVGESLDRVIMAEAAKHNDETWQRFIRPALSDKRGRADFATTPEGYNWFYDLWRLGLDDKFPDYKSWKFPSWENDIVYPGGMEDPEIVIQRETMDPTWFMQEIAADFASFQGKIYSEFDDAIHVKNHTFNPEWPNYITFDWGYARPMAAIEFQVSPQGHVYVWREWYHSGYTIMDMCAKLKARENPPGYRLDLCYGDAADPDAIQTVSTLFAPCWGDPEAKANWREGVTLIKQLLKVHHLDLYDEYERPLVKTMLTVDPACKNTIKEFNSYRTKENLTHGEEHRAKGVAETVDDHAMDALRYGLVSLFKLGARGNSLADVYNTTDQDNLRRTAYRQQETGSFFTMTPTSLSGMRF